LIASATSRGRVRDGGSASLKIACTGLPVIVPVTEFPDTIGVSLTNIVGSADPATMLKATAALRPMLDTSNEACMRE
jgi:multiple sugar transport system substrate-binding protein